MLFRSVKIATATRTLLVADETMAAIAFGDTPPPVASFDDNAMVASLGSASKRFWGGLRIGWLRADEQLVAGLARQRATVDLATPVMDQLAVAWLMRQGEDERERLADLAARRDRMMELLHHHLPDWRIERPAGGLSLWAELPAPRASALAAMAQIHGIRVTPGPRFGMDGAFERYMRLPFTLAPDEFEPAVERIAAAWRAMELRPGRATSASAWTVEDERVI